MFEKPSELFFIEVAVPERLVGMPGEAVGKLDKAIAKPDKIVRFFGLLD